MIIKILPGGGREHIINNDARKVLLSGGHERKLTTEKLIIEKLLASRANKLFIV